MPSGTGSNFSRSIAASKLPPERHEIECSLLRPPQSTPTRIFFDGEEDGEEDEEEDGEELAATLKGYRLLML